MQIHLPSPACSHCDRTFPIHTMTPIWIFPAYPLLLMGPIAANLIDALPDSAAATRINAIAIALGAVCLQGTGFLVSLMIYSAFIYRLMTQKLPRETTRPGMVSISSFPLIDYSSQIAVRLCRAIWVHSCRACAPWEYRNPENHATWVSRQYRCSILPQASRGCYRSLAVGFMSVVLPGQYRRPLAAYAPQRSRPSYSIRYDLVLLCVPKHRIGHCNPSNWQITRLGCDTNIRHGDGVPTDLGMDFRLLYDDPGIFHEETALAG